MKTKILLALNFLWLTLLTAWSWILTAPGLVLSTNTIYWQAQTYLWEHFYANRPLVTIVYALLVVASMVTFGLLLRQVDWATVSKRQLGTWLLLACLPLLLSYNALSYDVFNYLFNAKMVAVYHANPHVQVALDFPEDDWTRFMHNTHTTAPYGYGWTVVSLVPYFLGAGKFLPSWLALRLFNLGLLLILGQLVITCQKKLWGQPDYYRLWWLVGNPLVLVEIIGNLHNDLWMMVPMLASLYLLLPGFVSSTKPKKSTLLMSVVLYLFSLSIKYATLALLPVWLLLAGWPARQQVLARVPERLAALARRGLTWLQTYVFDVAALLMFLPLLTSRAQRFHPWYLVWSLTFLPLSRHSLTRDCLFTLSWSSLLRYLPYLWNNGYSPEILLLEQLISLGPVAVLLIYKLTNYLWQRQWCKLR